MMSPMPRLSPMQRLALLLALVLQILALPALAEERRVALVIGNSSYRNAQPLPNTLNDARDMTGALRKVGFEVVDGLDLDKRGMDQAVTRFARLARDADAVLFYYAGHGLQFNGENYLVPVEARVEDEVSVQYETTRLNDVITALGFARGVKIMVLDACRNNPFVRQLASKQATRSFAVGNGLAPIARAQGMVVAYATQANDVAADGAGRNSPFTAALVQEIQTPGLEIASMFRRVQKVVHDATGGRQTPELSLSLLGDFYLNREETDADVWRAIRASDDPSVLNGFIKRFPTSFFAIDARTKLDLIERRAVEERDRDRLAREFSELGVEQRTVGLGPVTGFGGRAQGHGERQEQHECQRGEKQPGHDGRLSWSSRARSSAVRGAAATATARRRRTRNRPKVKASRGVAQSRAVATEKGGRSRMKSP